MRTCIINKGNKIRKIEFEMREFKFVISQRKAVVLQLWNWYKNFGERIFFIKIFFFVFLASFIISSNLSKISNMKSICENITTLHGTAQLTRHKGPGLILWSCSIILTVGVMAAYVFVISKRYSNDQIITRVSLTFLSFICFTITSEDYCSFYKLSLNLPL